MIDYNEDDIFHGNNRYASKRHNENTTAAANNDIDKYRVNIVMMITKM